MSRIPETPTERAMKSAVDMEVHAACSTQTIAKARALDGHFPGYDDMLAALKVVSGLDIFHEALSMVDKAIAAAERPSIGEAA